MTDVMKKSGLLDTERVRLFGHPERERNGLEKHA
jgi:hypothetical protein